MAPQPGSAGGSEDTLQSEGLFPSDAIPDWVLYTSIVCGFVGMLLIGVVIANRCVAVVLLEWCSCVRYVLHVRFT